MAIPFDWDVDLRYTTGELAEKVAVCKLTPEQREALVPETGEDGGMLIPEEFATQVVDCLVEHGRFPKLDTPQ